MKIINLKLLFNLTKHKKDIFKVRVLSIIPENRICFCGSEKQISKCCIKKNNHKIEDVLTTIFNKNIRNTDFQMACVIRKKDGLCGKDSIYSHSISKSQNIENVDVYSIDETRPNKHYFYKKLSAKKASTFRCVCGDCDKKFSKLDENIFGKDLVIQNHFRSILYEIYTRSFIENRKKIIFKFFSMIDEELTNNGFFNKDINYLLDYYHHMYHPCNEIFLKEAIQQKELLEKYLDQNFHFIKNKKYPLYYKIIKVNDDKILSYCNAFFKPCYDINGNPFKNKKDNYYLCHDDNKYKISEFATNEYISFSVFKSKKNNCSYLILSCLNSDSNMIKYIRDFSKLKNIEDFINRYSFWVTKNVYFKKENIDILSEYEQNILLKYYWTIDEIYEKDFGEHTALSYYLMRVIKGMSLDELGYININDLTDIDVLNHYLSGCSKDYYKIKKFLKVKDRKIKKKYKQRFDIIKKERLQKMFKNQNINC